MEEQLTTPGVILTNPKFSHNVGAAIGACSCFGVHSLCWTGDRVDTSVYERLPREERMKGYRDVKWIKTARPFDLFPEATPVCVEITEGSQNLVAFEHPENAVYVFGPEDAGVPQVFKRLCYQFIFIPAWHCLNLSAALNVVLYDRWAKRSAMGLEKVCLADLVAAQEKRGEIEIPGWEGK